MIKLAWCSLRFQKDSALAQWCQKRTEDGRDGTRKTMIVAVARRLLIALWRMVTKGRDPARRRTACGCVATGANQTIGAHGANRAGFPTIRGGGEPAWQMVLAP